MLRAAAALSALLLAAVAAPAAHACAPAPPEGFRVSIEAEQALIIWEPDKGVEHFIRAGRFVSDAPDFGFLVPTPSVPTLAETDEQLFWRVGAQTRPDRIVRKKYEPGCIALSLFMAAGGGAMDGAMTGAAPPAVEVLHQQEVGGYDASVLRADDPELLKAWLEEHGYATRPALTEWLATYVEQAWIITAFKVAKSEDGGPKATTSAVRMSFETDRPFYPYREPTDMRGPDAPTSRQLVVDFLGPARVDAAIGDGSTAFPGEVTFARDRGERLTPVMEAAGLWPTEQVRWMTRFEDPSAPRPGVDELYFTTASDQGEIAPPPYTDYETVTIFLEPIAGLIGVPLVGLVWWRRRSKG